METNISSEQPYGPREEPYQGPENLGERRMTTDEYRARLIERLQSRTTLDDTTLAEAEELLQPTKPIPYTQEEIEKIVKNAIGRKKQQ